MIEQDLAQKLGSVKSFGELLQNKLQYQIFLPETIDVSSYTLPCVFSVSRRTTFGMPVTELCPFLLGIDGESIAF